MANYWLDNPEQTAQAEELWADGMGAGHIIDRLKMNCTRNSLLGYMHRAKLKRHGIIGKGGSKTHIHPIVPGPLRPHAHRERILEDMADEITMDETHQIHILKVKNGQCRWLMSDPADGWFCGSPVQPGSKNEWCPYHHRMGHNFVPTIDVRRRPFYRSTSR